MKFNSNKKYILNLETTSSICGVSIVLDNNILYENNIDNGLNHSITLFCNIDNALKKLNISMKNIYKIKVSNGPGSFTGLRIGIAAALGLAKTYNTPIEYVDTLDSLAYNAYLYVNHLNRLNDYNKHKSKSNTKNKYISKCYILSMIDARVDRVFISLYNCDTFDKLSNDSIISIDELCNILNNYFLNTNIIFILIGNGAVNYSEYINKNLNINYNIYESISNLKSSTLSFINGVESRVPFINYLLASKAERDRFIKNDNN